MSDLERQLLSGEAWERFCDRLRDSGRRLLSEEFPGGARGRAEGYRHLSRLLVFGLQWNLESGDPEFPVFCRTNDDAVRWGGMNVDNRNQRARIDGRHAYRIVGNAGNLHRFLVTVKNGDMQLERYGNQAEKSSDELAIGPGGEVEIVLAGERPAGWHGDFIPIAPDAEYVLLRQYLYDWDRDSTGWFAIERIGNEGRAPEPIGPELVAGALERAGEWVDRSLVYWKDYVEDARAAETDNQLGKPANVHGAPHAIRYGNGFFRLAPDQALVVEFDRPQARYWSIQLYNLGWFEALDFANRQTSLNGAQAHVDADDVVRVVICERDPGVWNWLDTESYCEGMIIHRWVWPDAGAEIPEARRSAVVPWDRVREQLPAETRLASPAERAAAIRARRLHVARRYRR
jgi:hypothetical protein